MADNVTQFAQIFGALQTKSTQDDFDVAHDFWRVLADRLQQSALDTDPRAQLRAEEAVVWRLLLLRMLREIGPETLFQSRSKGAGTGTAAAHPALEAIAKAYERMHRAMEAIEHNPDETPESNATGLPMRMMKVLEETEGFLEYALGLKPGETSPFSPGLPRKRDRADGADV